LLIVQSAAPESSTLTALRLPWFPDRGKHKIKFPKIEFMLIDVKFCFDSVKILWKIND